MMAEGGGRIVNMASITAFTGYSGLSVYSATKASLIAFTRSLAREVGRMGVNVNAVAPGFVDTEMTRTLKDEHREQIVRPARSGAWSTLRMWPTPWNSS
jgi:3-oxoacyl-[acyl-carrier protein] reductase